MAMAMASSCCCAAFASLSLSKPAAQHSGLGLSTKLSASSQSSIFGTTIASRGFDYGKLQRKNASTLRVLAAEEKKKTEVKKKVPSAVKRALKAKEKRVYHRARKSEMNTRMKKVFLALQKLKKTPEAKPDDLKPVEALIGEAYSIIDKSVKVHTIHKNKGAHRKSRLARAKKELEMQLGWYTPEPAVAEQT